MNKLDSDRYKYNVLILKELLELAEEYPKLRFGQLLIDFNILELVRNEDNIYIKDCFNEESEKMYRRMLKRKLDYI